MRRIHSPVSLANVEDAKARAFVVLFTCDAAARAILITLVPLEAYGVLGAAQLVSIVYFLVGLLGLASNLTVPLILHLLRRRWVLTIGALAQIASTLLFAWGTKASLVVGLAVQVVAMAMLDVVINLYLLDHIPRRGLNHFEPRRLLFAGTAFALGPWVGVYLHRNVGTNLTYVIAALSTLTLLTYFWTLRLTDNPSLQAGVVPPPSPLRFVSRFFAQPRLVLSWLLALGRNGWWVMNFIYTPIFVTSAGYRPEIGGALVSLGLAPMLLVRVYGRIGREIGIRNLLCVGYGLTGVCSLLAAVAAAAGAPLLCMALLWLAAFSATIIDGAGNVPFLRAVHHYERAEMTSVFMTFRQVGSIAVPGILAVVLWVLPLWGVFAVGGLIAVGMAGLSRYLPKRL
ncbi:MAG TPA: MFS transporter [Hyphomicrobiaceae bacterium]|jgi:MFS family permease|nr:MFS transporter [Hyphomicrobiaceae bacterium]